MRPYIVNLDSALDWTQELRTLYDRLDWERIRTAVAPNVSCLDWESRRDSLGLIGLASSLLIERSYGCFTEDAEALDDVCDSEAERWRDRQLRVSKEGNQPHENDSRRQFTGEEPHFRVPRVSRAGIVECFGIYVDDVSTILQHQGLRFTKLVPSALQHSPAILLCPERLYETYPTLLGMRQNFRHPLSLTGNPALVSLRMTLLHELGHHFFPVHQAGGGRYMSEGLANLFCYRALDDLDRVWLTYKTWHVQPPEYSAYRPLNVLYEADDDCRTAIERCFHGTLDGWSLLPKKGSADLEHRLSASLNMALAGDAAACEGLWRRELQPRMTEENRWFLHRDRGHSRMHMHFGRDGDVPADLVHDLYRESDLTPWLKVPGLPSDFWGSWGWRNDVRWPEDGFHALPRNADLLIERHRAATSKYESAALCRKLSALRADSRVQKYVVQILEDPAASSKPINGVMVAELDWILTLMVPSDTPLGRKWLQPFVEYFMKMDWHYGIEAMNALAVLHRIPDFRVHPILDAALDAAVLKIEAADYWWQAQSALDLIVACRDVRALTILEKVIAASTGSPPNDMHFRSSLSSLEATVATLKAEQGHALDAHKDARQ